ncbi:MAG: hypothetical protein AAB612_04800 [Patescibacteria group bacterium]
MWKDPDIFRRTVETAKNHMARAAEGRELLKQGKSLGEMITPITGLNPEQNDARRADYLDWISKFDDTELAKVYKNVLFQLHIRINNQDAGYSELLWQRIAFLDEFAKRNIVPPEDN